MNSQAASDRPRRAGFLSFEASELVSFSFEASELVSISFSFEASELVSFSFEASELVSISFERHMTTRVGVPNTVKSK